MVFLNMSDATGSQSGRTLPNCSVPLDVSRQACPSYFLAVLICAKERQETLKKAKSKKRKEGESIVRPTLELA